MRWRLGPPQVPLARLEVRGEGDIHSHPGTPTPPPPSDWNVAAQDSAVNAACNLVTVGPVVQKLSGSWLYLTDYSNKCTSLVEATISDLLVGLKATGTLQQLYSDALYQVRLCPAWKCVHREERHSHPGTPSFILRCQWGETTCGAAPKASDGFNALGFACECPHR